MSNSLLISLAERDLTTNKNYTLKQKIWGNFEGAVE